MTLQLDQNMKAQNYILHVLLCYLNLVRLRKLRMTLIDTSNCRVTKTDRIRQYKSQFLTVEFNFIYLTIRSLIACFLWFCSVSRLSSSIWSINLSGFYILDMIKLLIMIDSLFSKRFYVFFLILNISYLTIQIINQ